MSALKTEIIIVIVGTNLKSLWAGSSERSVTSAVLEGSGGTGAGEGVGHARRGNRVNEGDLTGS